MEQATRRSDAGGTRARRGRWIALALCAALLVVAARWLPLGAWLAELRGWVGSFGPLAVAVYVAIYVVAALLLVPGTLVTLAAGPLFGLWGGMAAVSVASTTAAALAFLIARYVARDAVARRARRDPRFEAIDRAIGAKGWRIVALLRLSPLFPYSIGNYLYGITAIRFWPYVAASWVAMLPATFLYVYLGHAGALGLAAAGGAATAGDRGKLALTLVGLLATAVVTVYVTRIALRAVRAATGTAGPNGTAR
jgi:uncharacterized membrane protein YdjX (TVP38/TMEM64 family)